MEKRTIESEIFYRIREISLMRPENTQKKLVEFLKTVKPRKQRTKDQNSALHLWFTMVAEALNNAGLTVQETLKHTMDIEWNGYRIKELVWRQAQKKYLNKHSTTQLDKYSDIDEIYDLINRWLSKMGVENIPFPYNPDKKKEMIEMMKPMQEVKDYPDDYAPADKFD